MQTYQRLRGKDYHKSIFHFRAMMQKHPCLLQWVLGSAHERNKERFHHLGPSDGGQECTRFMYLDGLPERSNTGGRVCDQQSDNRHSHSARPNALHTITRLIILIPLQCHRDSERERDFQKQGWRWREGKHIRLRDLQWLYISQCLVKAARQGSGNLIIA